VLKTLLSTPEGIGLIRGEADALNHLPAHSSSEVTDIFYDALLTARTETVQFMRMDLLELHPERREELVLCATKACIEYHILIPFLEPEILDKIRALGLIPDRST